MGDNAGNVTAGELSEMSLRVGGSSLRGGGASILTGRATLLGRHLTRRPSRRRPADRGGAAAPVPGAAPATIGTARTDAKGRFAYRAPAGPSRRFRFVFAGSSGLAPLTRAAQMRVRASSTIHASRRTLAAAAGALHRPARTARSDRTPVGQARRPAGVDGGRWRTFATARAAAPKAHGLHLQIRGTPGRYPVRVRIRREASSHTTWVTRGRSARPL